MQMNDERHGAGRAQPERPAKQEEVQRRLVILGLDDVDCRALDQRFGEDRGLPRERLRGQHRVAKQPQRFTICRVPLRQRLVDRHPMDDQPAIHPAFQTLWRRRAQLSNHMYGLAMGGEQPRHVIDVRADAPARYGAGGNSRQTIR